ncbi:hypothetical protein AB0C69_28500 [Actinomadura sp. NPDC048032]|uniref:DUF6907 domain-containing protein n=1 Tax=Actinomadura sp. NPDC048032 TaxID=3155747 RepID=UPI0033DF5F10
MNGEKLAIWQRRDCPTWCATRHRHTDAPVNRGCEYEPPGVPVSLWQAQAGGENLGPQLPTVTTALEWGQREIEPRLALSTPDTVTELTLEEADALSRLLARMVHEAREAVREVGP